MPKIKQKRLNLTLPIVLILSFFSCSREFNENEDYNYNDPVEVFGDNSLLFTKIFRHTDEGFYLWFDLRNEIANFSKPNLPFYYTQNESLEEHYRKIDLRGRLYEYNLEAKELKILNYPLNIIDQEEHAADIVYGFERKQKDDCSLLIDPQNKKLCERTYVLKFKRAVFSNIDIELKVNVPVTHNEKTITIQEMEQEFYLTN